MPMVFPTSPIVGQVFTSGGRSWVWTGSTWDSPASDNPPLAIPTGNAIINGAFDIWQRGTSFTTGGSGTLTFSADRWIYFNYGTNTGSCTQQTFTPGTAPVAGYEGSFFARFNSTSTTNFFQHRVEDVRTLAGQTATLSFFAKSASAQTLSVYVNQNFGSGGSSQVSIANTVSLTTSWARYTITVSMASLAGKTIGTSNFVGLEFVGAANNAIDIWGVQLEAGAVATPFKRNAPSIQAELAACQRYYEKSYSVDVAPGTVGGSGSIYQGVSSDAYANGTYTINFQVTKRVTPSLAVWSIGGVANVWTYHRNGVGDTNTGVTWTSWPGTRGGMAFVAVGAVHVTCTIWGHWAASAEL